eukprot:CAMPEP_0194202818 /NCGR_PEP_ID=MMETSP0156-20130528/2747_1 /TAXON_ID=33649 /ORGANISM="Thalassionema nitzschioides, Strain L26-B" /LENGTH=39 /DNA_ID= /DNA_START= /DNA_END= /DNA_ORIENTATION=
MADPWTSTLIFHYKLGVVDGFFIRRANGTFLDNYSICAM